MRFRIGFNGYSVKFSPFEDGRLAVASSQNFGIVGNGRQHVLQTTQQGLQEVAAFDTRDGVYDCAWSEENEHILASACGDGSIKVWDVAASPDVNPLRSLEEHAREVHSLSWNMGQRSLFLSASWDDSIKLWDINRPTSLNTFLHHTYCVYAAVWNPAHGDVFASCSGDCSLKIWDLRQPQPTLSIAAHRHEVLSTDWCKYNDCVLATGSVDKGIKIWDIRSPQQEVTSLLGHTWAVRRVLFSPHAENILASCSYDMTVRLWDVAAPEDALLQVWEHHTEFAVGVDFSMLSEGLLASTGWDEMVVAWGHHEEQFGIKVGHRGT